MLTQEMINELLAAITLLLEDLKDIQENSYHMDQLFNQLESDINDVEITILGLEQNAQNLDERLAQVLQCMMSKARDNTTNFKAIS